MVGVRIGYAREKLRLSPHRARVRLFLFIRNHTISTKPPAKITKSLRYFPLVLLSIVKKYQLIVAMVLSKNAEKKIHKKIKRYQQLLAREVDLKFSEAPTEVCPIQSEPPNQNSVLLRIKFPLSVHRNLQRRFINRSPAGGSAR